MHTWFLFIFLCTFVFIRVTAFVRQCMFLLLCVYVNVHAPGILRQYVYYARCACIFVFMHSCLFHMRVCWGRRQASRFHSQSGSISSGRPQSWPPRGRLLTVGTSRDDCPRWGDCTCALTYTHAHSHTDPHRLAHTDSSYTHVCTNMHENTHTYQENCTQSHTVTHMHAHSHNHTHTDPTCHT